ncbi:MAG: ATP-binding protein [Acidobacteria bacterium]|nr:ATP-binding protein [Acidobacteriota bacterium]
MKRWIARPDIEARIEKGLRHFPVTLILGPRQCGKTTLARKVCKARKGTYFDLEDPETALKPETAKLVLGDLKGLVVIDEVQRQPQLFALLRVLADRRPISTRFLILGSASPDLVKDVSESLAGRVTYVDMGGFLLHEVGEAGQSALWVRGGFPEAFLARSESASYRWRNDFIRSFLERDIPQLGIRIPAPALRRFWTMLAHYHGQIWNAAELGRAMGVKEDTARKYCDILSGAFMVRQLPPWFENIGKRLVKAPKVYLRDSGLLHTLLGLKGRFQVLSHPKFGFSWEGFALEHIIRFAWADRDAYFYRTHAGAELDLMLLRHGRRYGFEFKYEDAPTVTRSMRVAFEDLKLERLWVIHPGERSYPLSEYAEVVPLAQVPVLLRKHRLV